jgi:pyrroline-5-carboxylate reductase
MPNTPALVQTGATGLYAGADVSQADRQQAAAVLGATGLVLWVEDEQLMHAVTAVSGSGPAYFFYWMEAMIAAGQQLGLSEQVARDLTLQTALGAAQMAITSGEPPSKLRQNVTSPNGTTQAALESMAQHQVGELIEQALLAAAARSTVLSNALDLG